MSVQVQLNNVRASYVHVFERHKQDAEDEGDGKYSIQVIISKKDKKSIKAMKDGVKKALEEAKAQGIKGKKQPLRDADEEEREGAEYTNTMFFNASSNRKPGLVDQSGRNIITDPDEFCSGDYMNIIINLYPFKVKGNSGVAAGLQNIQLVKRGERLDGSVPATQAFDPVDGYDDDEDDDDPLD
jgi:hypothetical protein